MHVTKSGVFQEKLLQSSERVRSFSNDAYENLDENQVVSSKEYNDCRNIMLVRLRKERRGRKPKGILSFFAS